MVVTLHLTNEKTEERGVTGPRPDGSQKQIKDGEARPPVSGNAARALGNGPRTAPAAGLGMVLQRPSHWVRVGHIVGAY